VFKLFLKRALAAAFAAATLLMSACGGGGGGESPAAGVPAGVAVNPQPATGVVGSTATFSVTPSGSAPHTYQWIRNGVDIPGATADSHTTAATVLGDNGALYAVRVSNDVGSSVSAAATLTVTPSPMPPSLSVQPQSLAVAQGTTATFGVAATGSSSLAYQWSRNGVPVAGATAALITTAPTVAGDNGAAYTVAVSNAQGSITSAAATLTVSSVSIPAGVASNPQAISVTVGGSASFTVVASGTAPHTYQWRRGGVAIAGATNPSYTTAATVLGDDAAEFDVVVSNALASSTSARARLSVSAAPVAPTITSQPAGMAVQVGSSALFAVQASGSAPFTYQWTRGGVDIPGATAASYTTPVSVLGDNGASFAVRVGNAAATVTSTAALLQVSVVPVAPAITVQPANVVARGAGNTTLTVTATGTALAYQWLKSGSVMAGATSATLTLNGVALADAGAYAVLVSNTAGAVVSNAALLSVIAPSVMRPMVSAGREHSLAVSGTGQVFAWGRGAEGQLGIVFPDPAVTVRAGAVMTALTGAKQVSAGQFHSVALLADGTVQAWGDQSGGTPTGTADLFTPNAVPGLSGMVQVSAGFRTTAALDATGKVWAMGAGVTSLLGDGSTSAAATYVPQLVTGLQNHNVVQFEYSRGRPSTGAQIHQLALLADGSVLAWGDNAFGQVGGAGVGTRVGCTDTVVTGPKVCTPVVVPGVANAVQVAPGSVFSAALLADGTVRAWGFAGVSALTNPNDTVDTPWTLPGLANIVSIASGTRHLLALAADGTLYGWGFNDHGELGNASAVGTTVTVPTVISAAQFGSPIRSIAAGDEFSLVVLQDGSVYSFGLNSASSITVQYGQLGQNSTVLSTATPGYVRDLANAALYLAP
jgi:alpha-tubulin suppressor-like RCC1 family protein